MVDITRSTTLTVRPIKPTPKHKIWLSNLDIVAARGYTPLVFFYPPPNPPNHIPDEVFRDALAKALVPFYPFAGRLVRDAATGRPEIHCTGEGVELVIEELDATVEEFRDFVPSAEIGGKIVPLGRSADPPCAILMVQLSRLRCGGIILGFAVHHYTFDGYGGSLFINTFTAFARGGDPKQIPSPFFDRHRLRARSPLSISFDHSDYTPKVYQSNCLPTTSSSQVHCAHLTLTKDQVHALKLLAGGTRVSTFRAVTAHVWKCVCIACRLDLDSQTELLLPVDMRERLRPPLPRDFIGNPTLRTKAVARVSELLSNTIQFGADLIQKAIERMTDEYVHSLIDHLETLDLEALSKRGPMSKTSLMAVSWLKYNMYGADFGWGRPMLMARGQMYGSGYVYLNHFPAMKGAVSVIVGLEPDSLQCFKKIFYTWSSRL